MTKQIITTPEELEDLDWSVPSLRDPQDTDIFADYAVTEFEDFNSVSLQGKARDYFRDGAYEFYSTKAADL